MPPHARLAMIIVTLERLGATSPCPRCGHAQFEVLGESQQTLMSDRPMVVPTIVLSCTQCGFLVHHAAKILGLIKDG